MAENTKLDSLLDSFTTDSNLATDIKAAARELVLEAKAEALKVKAEAEKYHEESVKKQETLLQMHANVEEKINELSTAREDAVQALAKASSYSVEDAKTKLFELLDKQLAEETAKKIRDADESVRAEADRRARDILVTAMQRVGTQNVAEYTTYTVDLPDEAMKGRIIGKDGRNIKAFEEASGVSVEIGEEGEPTVTVSSFDPVRREVARRALEALIVDGRIQPVRIEEAVQKAGKEVEQVVKEAGEDVMFRAGVTGLPLEIVMLLGRLKFRTSYGQNMIEHALEVVKIGTAIASEVGADVEIVRKACLLHDIGKAVTAETDKGHAEAGAEICRRYGVSEDVVQAFEFHHKDTFPTKEAVVMYLADAISGSRPGARKEDYDKYVARVKELEEIAASFKGVMESYAISAGREVRVLVNPAEITDAEMVKLAHDISKKIHDQVSNFPAPIKVHVVRETKAIAIVKPH